MLYINLSSLVLSLDIPAHTQVITASKGVRMKIKNITTNHSTQDKAFSRTKIINLMKDVLISLKNNMKKTLNFRHVGVVIMI